MDKSVDALLCTDRSEVFFRDVDQFVEILGGARRRAIKRVLIANNGISAVKAIRSIRRWSYETFRNEKEIEFISMATPEDLAANSEYIRMADVVVEVEGGSNNNNYANVARIVSIAEMCSADAVWAGWGHASENPLLPSTLETKGIVFIGPPAGPMCLLGNKIESTIIAQSAQVPTIQWNGSHLKLENFDETRELVIPPEILEQAFVKNSADALEKAKLIGYPLMIKASEGGGGKGIRVARCANDISAAYRHVASEVPGSPIFMMKEAMNCRHIEIQLLGDLYGNVITLNGRDCSMQRRHQKIIEEGPPLAPSDATFVAMQKSAVRLAKMVSYENAGTVEFLHTLDDHYYFLELNPRLQVEHPVTEMITDVNLPACQLMVAMGIPLNAISDIRRLYCLPELPVTAIDFDNAPQRKPQGHVIACRITAENPDLGFQPTSGVIKELNFTCTPDVWGYFSISSYGSVHEFADSQFGHVFAFGKTRGIARRNMICALKEFSVRGDIRTTIEYLIGLLESKDFMDYAINTSWLDRRLLCNIQTKHMDALEVVLIAAVCLASRRFDWQRTEFIQSMKRGQVPSSDSIGLKTSVDLIYQDLKYQFTVSQAAPTTYTVNSCQNSMNLNVKSRSDGGFLVTHLGRNHLAFIESTPTGQQLNLDGKTCLFSVEYDPSRLCAMNAGKLVRYLLPNETEVKKGASYAEIEVMKMYMPLIVPEDGVIHYILPEGSTLTPGDLIASLDVKDPSKIRKADIFDGFLPVVERTPRLEVRRPQSVLTETCQFMKAILDGYDVDELLIADTVSEFSAAIQNEYLPFLEFCDALSVWEGRLPEALLKEMNSFSEKYNDQSLFIHRNGHMEVDLDVAEDRDRIKSLTTGEFPVRELRAPIQDFLSQCTAEEKGKWMEAIRPFLELAEKYNHGIGGFEIKLYRDFFQLYLETEKLFLGNSKIDELVNTLKNSFPPDDTGYSKMYSVILASRAKKTRNQLMIQLLKSLPKLVHREQGVRFLEEPLTELASLTDPQSAVVALEARLRLMALQAPSISKQKERIVSFLKTVSGDLEIANLQPLIEEQEEIGSALLEIMNIRDDNLMYPAALIYLCRIYISYSILSMSRGPIGHSIIFSFKAKSSPTNSPGLESDMRRSDSYHILPIGSDTTDPQLPPNAVRQSIFFYCRDMFEFEDQFSALVSYLQSFAQEPLSPLHAIHVVMQYSFSSVHDEPPNDFVEFIQQHSKDLELASVRRISLTIPPDSAAATKTGPRIFTFPHSRLYHEDLNIRNIEAPLTLHLELSRLSSFTIKLFPAPTQTVHTYEGISKDTKGALVGKRFFARAMVRSLYTAQFPYSGGERAFVEALNSIELAMSEHNSKPGNSRRYVVENNQIFLSILPETEVTLEMLEESLEVLWHRYASMIKRNKIGKLEFKIKAQLAVNKPSQLLLLVASNPTGLALKIESYMEVFDPYTQVASYMSISDHLHSQAELDGCPVMTLYPVNEPFERQRITAKAAFTVYCYDFIELLNHALEQVWEKYSQLNGGGSVLVPHTVLVAKELILDGPEGSESLKEVSRPFGQNTIAMVAWRLTIYTPAFRDGREVILIANDITRSAGSFGTKEDLLFSLATTMARERGIPRLFFAANSGARIGLAEELKKEFQVAWKDPNDPLHGFDYLYVTPEQYQNLRPFLCCEEVRLESSEVRYKLQGIIGREPDLGVENLRGSGRIAGDTSRAYRDIFTLTYVSARSVGIGAYLVRLGHRTIQKSKEAPIILTGYQALNKLMGKSVYTSNHQLGGPHIMYQNGISHLVVQDDLEGMVRVLEWLEYIPRTAWSSPLPVLLPPPSLDVLDRPVVFHPPMAPYDPREMLAGVEPSVRQPGPFVAGFFDRGSFMETLAGWAKTVVCGRGRLGGIPCGVIATENRTVDRTIPADPAIPLSQELNLKQAGGVWFPDSAHKTATAIRDFNREGLPLFIFANWRGFSGGAHDMFEEVLKFGATIVDALVEFQNPVFIYIPSRGELRGGSWVVLDPTINEDMMEMYVAEDSRGGVLEPPAVVEIKYRRDLLQTCHRLDGPLRDLDRQLESLPPADGGSSSAAEGRTQLTKRKEEREEALGTVYKQIAEHFADLHDSPGRMLAKGVIRRIVPWEESRVFFYHRLVRRLQELEKVRQLAAVAAAPHRELLGNLREWFLAEGPRPAESWEDDRAVAEWLKSSAFDGRLEEWKRQRAESSLPLAVGTNEIMNSLVMRLPGLSKDQQGALAKGLSDLFPQSRS